MPALLFPDADTLRVALEHGVVPPEVAAAPARAGTDADDRTWVQPSVPLPPDPRVPLARRPLGRVGVRQSPPGPDEPSGDVEPWFQLAPLRHAPTPVGYSAALVLGTTAHAAAMSRTLRRLGLATTPHFLDDVVVFRVDRP